MPTDDERREVAERLRGLDYADLQESLICAYLDALGIEGYEDWVGIAHRLADLIEPSTVVHECVPGECPINVRPSNADGLDLDAILRTCHELMEWCDGPEWTLCSTIYDAVLTYFGEVGGWEEAAADWNRRAERTCRNLSSIGWKFTCSECHSSIRPGESNMPNYCPNCGAKVVSE